jgi:phage-related protein
MGSWRDNDTAFLQEYSYRSWFSFAATPARTETYPAPSRPMPSIGPNCHELRIVDENVTWRIVYRLYADAVLILEVFEKKTSKTPKTVIDVCKSRLKRYEQDMK